ncbi:MAG: hypothetical protein HXX20_09355 [Chloroflexi bacterium]|nr:hypothetical protein [Chloroflexota bacterium]
MSRSTDGAASYKILAFRLECGGYGKLFVNWFSLPISFLLGQDCRMLRQLVAAS